MKKVTKKKTVKKAKRKTKNQFQKGNTKSKGYGRPPMTDAEKELSLKTRTELKSMIQKYLVQSFEDLKELSRSEKVPAIDAMLVQSLVNAINSGDQTKIDCFLNHAMGKEREVTNLHLSGGTTDSINVKNLSKKELLALKEIAEASKGKK